MTTLISFLGTGAYTEKDSSTRTYRTATYTFKEKEVGTSGFVSSILYDYLAIDHLILIGTAKSMWEEVYRYFTKKLKLDFDESYYWYLVEAGEKANHLTPVDAINLAPLERVLGGNSKVKIIPYGLNEQEQWLIFNTLTEVFENLEAAEEIFLDVTHAFRSLPMFSMTAFMYLQDVSQSNIKLKGIYYGILETSREFDGKTPIVDLSLILKLQDWIKGAYSFLNFGKGYLIADLLKNKQHKKLVLQFSDALALNYLSEIEKYLLQFKKLAAEIKEPIAKMILAPQLKKFTDRLLNAKTRAHFQLELSIWHLEQKNYATAYLVYVEALTTFVCEKEGFDWQDIHDRNRANGKIRRDPNYLPIKSLQKESKWIRNNIAHSQRESEDSNKPDLIKLKNYQQEFLSILNIT